jgi:hypothetical protein
LVEVGYDGQARLLTYVPGEAKAPKAPKPDPAPKPPKPPKQPKPVKAGG